MFKESKPEICNIDFTDPEQIKYLLTESAKKRLENLYSMPTIESVNNIPELTFTHDQRETMRIQSLAKRRKDLQKLEA